MTTPTSGKECYDYAMSLRRFFKDAIEYTDRGALLTPGLNQYLHQQLQLHTGILQQHIEVEEGILKAHDQAVSDYYEMLPELSEALKQMAELQPKIGWEMYSKSSLERIERFRTLHKFDHDNPIKAEEMMRRHMEQD